MNNLEGFYLSPCGEYIIESVESFYWEDCLVVHFSEYENNLCMTNIKFNILLSTWSKLE